MPSLKHLFILPVLLLTGLAVHYADLNDANELVKQANELKENAKEEEALELYLEALNHDTENYDALWNASFLHSTIGFRFDNEDRQKDYFEYAVEFAEKAIESYPDSAHPYYAMAVAKGRMADVVGTRTRISLAHEVEENVKKAIDIKPDHAPSWHLYGVWQSEVANVSRAERTAARFISRGLPDGSNETAVEYLEKAMELDPENLLIPMDMARHYLRIGEDDEAIPWLEKVIEMEPLTMDDPDHQKEAEELLAELR